MSEKRRLTAFGDLQDYKQTVKQTTTIEVKKKSTNKQTFISLRRLKWYLTKIYNIIIF